MRYESAIKYMILYSVFDLQCDLKKLIMYELILFKYSKFEWTTINYSDYDKWMQRWALWTV